MSIQRMQQMNINQRVPSPSLMMPHPQQQQQHRPQMSQPQQQNIDGNGGDPSDQVNKDKLIKVLRGFTSLCNKLNKANNIPSLLNSIEVG